MRPIQFVSDRDLESWGNAELEAVAEFYTSPQYHTNADGKLCQSDPFLECTTAQVMEEWRRCKMLVKANMYPTHSLSSLWGALASLHQQGDLNCPHLLQLACLALTHPVHTCDCERAFSVQNLTLTPLRNRLSSDRCEQLMRVKIEGGPMSEFDFSAAVRKWAETSRRIKVNKV